jgi:hypothetical protein
MNIRFLVIITLILAVFILASCNDLSQEEVEQIIAKSEKLRQLDRFCNELPKPDGFKFVYKKVVGNREFVHISYRYKTDLTYSNVKHFYTDYFEENGWKQEHSWSGYIEYRNGKRLVSVEQVNFIDTNYSLGCTEEKLG